MPSFEFNRLNNRDAVVNPTGDVFVSVHVSDLGHTGIAPPGAKTDVETLTVTVAAVNDPPTVTLLQSAFPMFEGTNDTATLNWIAITGVSVADLDETEPSGTGELLVTLTVADDGDTANGTLSLTPFGSADVPVTSGRVLTIEGTQGDINGRWRPSGTRYRRSTSTT